MIEEHNIKGNICSKQSFEMTPLLKLLHLLPSLSVTNHFKRKVKFKSIWVGRVLLSNIYNGLSEKERKNGGSMFAFLEQDFSDESMSKDIVENRWKTNFSSLSFALSCDRSHCLSVSPSASHDIYTQLSALDSWLSVLLIAAFANKLDTSGKPAQLVRMPVHPIMLLILLLCFETMQALQQCEHPDCRVPSYRL